MSFKDLTPQDPAHLERYAQNLADIFACRQPPGTGGTDRAFLFNKQNREFDNMHPTVAAYYRQEAEKAGVNPKGKCYMPSLASRPGDPEAWISDLHDVKRICEQRGWGCEGAVTVKREDFDAAPKEGKYEVADSIVERYTDEVIEANPGIAETPKERADLKEQVREKITPDY